MSIRSRVWDLTGGALLMRAGRAGRLTTIGRRSGQPRTSQCGYIRRPDGRIVVGSAIGRQWPQNLAAAGTCTFEARGLPPWRYSATVLTGAARQEALAEVAAARGAAGTRMYSGLIFELTLIDDVPDDGPAQPEVPSASPR